MFRNSSTIWFQLENLREPDNNQPFGNFAEGLFCLNFFKKEGFLKDLSYNLINIGLAYPGKEEL